MNKIWMMLSKYNFKRLSSKRSSSSSLISKFTNQSIDWFLNINVFIWTRFLNYYDPRILWYIYIFISLFSNLLSHLTNRFSFFFLSFFFPSSHRFRPGGPGRATQCDLWWALYLPPSHSRPLAGGYLLLRPIRSRSRLKRPPNLPPTRPTLPHGFWKSAVLAGKNSLAHRKTRPGDPLFLSMPTS